MRGSIESSHEHINALVKECHRKMRLPLTNLTNLIECSGLKSAVFKVQGYGSAPSILSAAAPIAHLPRPEVLRTRITESFEPRCCATVTNMIAL